MDPADTAGLEVLLNPPPQKTQLPAVPPPRVVKVPTFGRAVVGPLSYTPAGAGGHGG